MDVWTVLAVVVAFAVVIVLGPPAIFRHWSWRERIARLRRR
jgi:hypothetical protein